LRKTANSALRFKQFNSYLKPLGKNLAVLYNQPMSILIKNAILNNKKQDILIEDNFITKIADFIDVKADELIDCHQEKAIMPGLYNMHTHSAMSLLRGYADDMELMDWLQNKIWPQEAKFSQDDIYWGSKLAMLEMIKTGTLFFNDMYFFPEATVKAVKEMGMRALIGLVIFDGSEQSNPKMAEARLAEFKKQNLQTIQFCIAPHAIYTVGKESLLWCKQFAQANNLLIHTHLSETKKEVDDCLAQNNLRPAHYLDSLGLLGENTILAHSVWLDASEKKLLGAKKCSVVNNPVSNLKLVSNEIFDYQGLKDSGANILLGTDGASSNNNLDLVEEMKFACVMQKHKQQNAKSLPAQEVIDMATINGAKAVRINGGEIKEGKLADFILIDLNDVSLIPGFNLASDLVYSSNGNCVTDVICNGKIIMRDRMVEGEKEIKEKAKEWAKKI